MEDLIRKMPELIELDKPFTKEEIDAVVKELPSDKELGPDGFNTDFIEKLLGYLCSRLLQAH